MELFSFFIDAFLSILLIFTTIPAVAQSTNTNITDFSCSTSICRTYIVYRTQAPDFLDLSHVSDLFGVSRLSMMKANNLPSEDVIFLPDQLVFVPILCGCTENQSFANITYDIKSGDSFYLVSIGAFENLTDYHAVQDSNPTLVPTKLKVGQEVTFPIYCKCPAKAQLDQGVNFLVTYVWQLGDDVSALSKRMNSSDNAIMAANNNRNLSAAVAFPILIPMSMLPRVSSPIYYNSTPLPVKENHKSVTVLIIIASLLGFLLVLLSSFLVISYCKRCPQKWLCRMASGLETTDLLKSKSMFSSDDTLSPNMAVDKLLTGVTEYIDKPVVFETKTIIEATMNLDQRFRLGSSVYRATLKGEVFAVKERKGDVTEEVNILRKINHANLVKLAGVSTETDGSCFLVYEFAENGSLDKWLYPKSPSSSSKHFLSWKQRLMIALDVANGLQYMHEHTRPSIVHRDIRTRNILLNTNFKAKISNFSIAGPASNSVSPTIDVFGFGIVLLELLSGRRAMETRGAHVSTLWKEIRKVLEVKEEVKDMLRQWMDPSLGEFYPIDGAFTVAAMAKACTSEVSSERPKMFEVVFSLSLLAYSCSSESERGTISLCSEAISITNPLVAR